MRGAVAGGHCADYRPRRLVLVGDVVVDPVFAGAASGLSLVGRVLERGVRHQFLHIPVHVVDAGDAGLVELMGGALESGADVGFIRWGDDV